MPAVDPRIQLIISTNGARRNVTKLGDLLLDSYDFFEKKHAFDPGVVKCQQFHLCLPEDKFKNKFIRRFAFSGGSIEFDHFYDSMKGISDTCYIINGEAFLNGLWAKHQHQIEIHTGVVNDLAIKDTIKIKTISGEIFDTHDLFLANGPFAKFIPTTFYHSTTLERHKSISGGVWSAPCQLGEQSFVVTVDMSNLVYNGSTQTIQIVGKSDENAIDPDVFMGIKSNYQLFAKIVKNMPAYDKGTIYSSFRSKGRNRVPFYKSEKFGNNRVTQLCGLYKNGYTNGPFLAYDLVRNL